MQINRKLVLALSAVLSLSGCQSLTQVKTEAQATTLPREVLWMVAELCHDRTRLLATLSQNELTEQEVFQQRALMQQGQDRFFKHCMDENIQRLPPI